MAYFSNSTDGSYLDDQCCDCPLADDAPCPILLAQIEWNYKQLDSKGEKTDVSEVLNLLINEKGDCQMKPILDKQFAFTKDSEGIPFHECYVPQVGDVIRNELNDTCTVEAFKGEEVSVVYRHSFSNRSNPRVYPVKKFTDMAIATLKREGTVLERNTPNKDKQ